MFGRSLISILVAGVGRLNILSTTACIAIKDSPCQMAEPAGVSDKERQNPRHLWRGVRQKSHITVEFKLGVEIEA